MSNLDHILNPQLVDQYFKELEASGVPASTLNRKQVSLNQLLSWARDRGYLTTESAGASEQERKRTPPDLDRVGPEHLESLRRALLNPIFNFKFWFTYNIFICF